MIHFVSGIPYNYIFPKMYGVIHHGGSGTTHLALKHACASMIIPHIFDQFVWDKILYRLGVGPRGLKISNLSIKSLEPKIIELVSNLSYKKKAGQIAKQMKEENLRRDFYNALTT